MKRLELLSLCGHESCRCMSGSNKGVRLYFTWGSLPLYRSIRHGREYFMVQFFSYIRDILGTEPVVYHPVGIIIKIWLSSLQLQAKVNVVCE